MGVLLCISFKVYRLSTNGSETKEKERKVLLNLPNQKHLQHLLEIILLQNLKIMHQPLLLQKILKQRKKGEIDWEAPVLFSDDNKPVCKDDFELLKVIGKGSFGKVMQVKKKDDGQIYAMKVLRKEAIIARKQVDHTRAEKAILQKIDHPFIVKLNYAFQTEEKLYMVLDFVNGGELFFHLKKEGKFSEERVRLYSAEIALALHHLHSRDIVYRDLKPENILIDADGHICITDFGLSKEISSDEVTHTFCGTPEYLAPEVLKGQGHGCPVDWWSLGTLIYEMLTGLPPFYSQNINIMYQKILNGELRFPETMSPDACSLLEGVCILYPHLFVFLLLIILLFYFLAFNKRSCKEIWF